MKLTFYNNYLNHHTVHIADELYKILGSTFHFVATLPFNKDEMKGGLDYSFKPYLLLANNDKASHCKAMSLAKESDVCLFFACSQEYAIERAKKKECGLSFELGERWLKRGMINLLSPNLIRWWLNYIRYYYNKPFYKLCCSGYAATDDRKMFAYKDRHFKWGYFTKVDEDFVVEAPHNLGVSTSEITTHIMWCSRFLRLKHPELPVRMALKLKEQGYNFMLDMYGSGGEEETTKQLVTSLGVEDVVKFHGALPNEEILKAMRQHEIFLFTSDRYEGWGAVANEAMANGCVLVASDAIGSTPYLIIEGKNGFSFKSEDADSLTDCVKRLLDNPADMYQMQKEARNTMVNLWSPRKAALSLLTLIDDLQNGRECSILNGPCSKDY